jgi:hypothetical protein
MGMASLRPKYHQKKMRLIAAYGVRNVSRSSSPLSRRIHPALTGDVEETPAMGKVLISAPEDLEQVLKSMIERDSDKGAELLRARFESRLTKLYQQWQVLHISTSRFAELLSASPWELADLLHTRRLKTTNLPG